MDLRAVPAEHARHGRRLLAVGRLEHDELGGPLAALLEPFGRRVVSLTTIQQRSTPSGLGTRSSQRRPPTSSTRSSTGNKVGKPPGEPQARIGDIRGNGHIDNGNVSGCSNAARRSARRASLGADDR